jgi:hypothetical protein
MISANRTFAQLCGARFSVLLSASADSLNEIYLIVNAGELKFSAARLKRAPHYDVLVISTTDAAA